MSDFPHLGLRLAYNGSNFSGMQLQPHRRSVQGELERALRTLLKRPVRILFSSRTDTGVHAYDQWVMIREGRALFESLTVSQQDRFLISLNSLLQNKASVWDLFWLHQDFRPQTHALWKEYSYCITQGTCVDPLLKNLTWNFRRSLDIALMRRALKGIIGAHDFCALSKSRSSRDDADTVREILSASIRVSPHRAMTSLQNIEIVIRGRGFLQHMVRTIVGTLVEMGRGEREPNFLEILESRDRRRAGLTAPPHGLTLKRTKVSTRWCRPLEKISSPEVSFRQFAL